MPLRSKLLRGATATLVIAFLTPAGCTKAGMSKAGTAVMVTGGLVTAAGVSVTAGCSGDDRPCAGSGDEVDAGTIAGITIISVGALTALIGLLLWYKASQK